jgi:hypothetical protein
MALSIPELLSFEGEPGEDVTLFLRHVKRVALVNNHSSDDEWMAEYIEACLAGDALIWYTDLDKESRRNFDTLRKLLLLRFPTSAAAPSPAVAVPNAAAVALPQPYTPLPVPKRTQIGRIRIDEVKGHTFGYCGRMSETHEEKLSSGPRKVTLWRFCSTRSPTEALQVRLEFSDDNTTAAMFVGDDPVVPVRHVIHYTYWDLRFGTPSATQPRMPCKDWRLGSGYELSISVSEDYGETIPIHPRVNWFSELWFRRTGERGFEGLVTLIFEPVD